MTLRPDILLLLGVLAVVSVFCRFSGFWLMRFVPITPRIEATLKATPLAVMAGIVTPAALRGSWPEWMALAVTIAAMRLVKNDSAAAIVGVTALAVLRSLQLAA